MKNLLIAVILLVTISCSKKDDHTPEPTPVVNETDKFVGNFMVVDTGYISHTYTSTSGSGNEGCVPPMIIDRHHESEIVALSSNRIKITNFFGDTIDAEFILTTNTEIKSSGNIWIKYNGCGTIIATGNYDKPKGDIVSNHDTIVITHEYEDTYMSGAHSVTKINNFTSTFVRQ